jgi:hypothetical protein
MMMALPKYLALPHNLRNITSNTRPAPPKTKQQLRSDEPVWHYSLEDTAFPKMEVPVVGASDDQLLLQLRLGGHCNRPQVQTCRGVEVDAARTRRPEEGGLCWVWVSADSGGVDGDLHWLRSLYSIGPLRWRARRPSRGSKGAGDCGLRERAAPVPCVREGDSVTLLVKDRIQRLQSKVPSVAFFSAGSARKMKRKKENNDQK